MRNRMREFGGATVEFALMVTILTPTVLYGVFFYEASLAKLKTNEASRYLVWEMTVMGLSDWQKAQHDNRFNSLKSQITNEVNQRWADDLESASPTFTGGAKAMKPITLDVTVDTAQTQLLNQDAGIYNVSFSSGADLSKFGGTIDSVLSAFGYNRKGKAQGKFIIKVHNKFLHKTMPIGPMNSVNMLMNDDINIPSTQSLIADQWDLKDGGDVLQMENESTGGWNCTSGAGGCSDYLRQVARVGFFGLGNIIPGGVSSAIQGALNPLGVRWPLSAVVSSKALSGGDSGIPLYVPNHPDDNSGNHIDDHDPLDFHHTNVFQDTFKAKDSLYNKVYKRLGRYYMGCKQPQKEEPGSGSNECKY